MSNLVVLFPGIGYTCDRPLLYYARKVAEEAGYDKVISIPYSRVNKKGLRKDPEKMMNVFRTLYRDSTKRLEDVDWCDYDKILFISKSIGTVISCAIENDIVKEWNNNPDKEYALPPIKQILFTPLEETFVYYPQNAMGFIGTDDPWCSYEEVIRLANKQFIALNRYPGANHSLETGDIPTDINNLNEVMSKCKYFINNC